MEFGLFNNAYAMKPHRKLDTEVLLNFLVGRTFHHKSMPGGHQGPEEDGSFGLEPSQTSPHASLPISIILQ